MPLDLRVAGVDDLRGYLPSVERELDRRDPARAGIVAERDDGVLHRDEVPVAEIAGGAVVARAGDVVRVELDETLTALAEQADGHQPHFAAQLLLDVGDERGAAAIVHAGDGRLGRSAGGAGLGALALERPDLRPERREVVAGGRRGLPGGRG